MQVPMNASSSSRPQWNFLEALAGWLIPGLGHWLLGQRRRGLIVGLSILALWAAGLLIGGIGVIHRVQNPAWFIGQATIGPSLAIDLYRANLDAHNPAPRPGRKNAYEPSFGRMNELGILYTTLAGLLNVLAVIDVIYCDPALRRAVAAGQPRPLPVSPPAP